MTEVVIYTRDFCYYSDAARDLLTRKGVAASIINSKEHRLQVVAGCYADLLHRPPTPTEATAFANMPGSFLALQLNLLSGTEFYEHG